VRSAVYDVLDARSYALSPALDLYAGSGALGIEALSRGAESCDFVERNPRNVSVIEENLRSLGLLAGGTVIRADAAAIASRLDGRYALVLADPPYDDSSAACVLRRLVESGILAEESTLVFEQTSRQASPPTLGRLARAWERRYGDTQVTIYRPPETRSDQSEEDRS
jgi:16S rRNA (guanine966-N2)-methyltransferase